MWMDEEEKGTMVSKVTTQEVNGSRGYFSPGPVVVWPGYRAKLMISCQLT